MRGARAVDQRHDAAQQLCIYISTQTGGRPLLYVLRRSVLRRTTLRTYNNLYIVVVVVVAARGMATAVRWLLLLLSIIVFPFVSDDRLGGLIRADGRHACDGRWKNLFQMPSAAPIPL